MMRHIYSKQFKYFIFSFVSAFLFSCSARYPILRDESVNEQIIEQASIVFFPFKDAEYAPPPPGCLGPNRFDAKYPGNSAPELWEKSILQKAQKSFPNQTISSLPQEFEISSANFYKIYLQLDADIEKHNLYSKSTTQDTYGLFSTTKEEAESMARLLNPLANFYDFAVFFAKPKLTGEEKTSYSHNAATNSMEPSTTTVFTGDIRIMVYEIHSGKPIFLSGTINLSQGFCIFVDPVQGAVNASSSAISKKLHLIFAYLNSLHHTGTAWMAN
jgi:hypothetical protein